MIQKSTIFSDVSERHTMQEHLNEFVRWAAKLQLQIAEHKCCVLSTRKCYSAYILYAYCTVT